MFQSEQSSGVRQVEEVGERIFGVSDVRPGMSELAGGGGECQESVRR